MATRKPAGARPEPHIVLLRGINVGGRNRLAMATLVDLCAGLGCHEVQTYIQSGNLVLRGPNDAAALRGDLAAAITRATGLEVPVVVLTRAQLAAAVAKNPFVAQGCDPDTLHVVFLAGRPAAKALASLPQDRSPGDAFACGPECIWLHLPGGVARSKLTNAWFDAALGTTSTIRNWKTVRKLLQMAT